MSDYTPTTDDIRASYREAIHEFYQIDEEFDRWLAEVERKAAEKALLEAAAFLETPRYISTHNEEPPMLRMTKEQIVDHLCHRAAEVLEGKECK